MCVCTPNMRTPWCFRCLPHSYHGTLPTSISTAQFYQAASAPPPQYAPITGIAESHMSPDGMMRWFICDRGTLLQQRWRSPFGGAPEWRDVPTESATPTNQPDTSNA